MTITITLTLTLTRAFNRVIFCGTTAEHLTTPLPAGEGLGERPPSLSREGRGGSLFLPSYFVDGVADEFVDEGLPVADDVEGGEPIALLALYLDYAVGDVRVGRDAFLLEGHQGAAHVGGSGD